MTWENFSSGGWQASGTASSANYNVSIDTGLSDIHVFFYTDTTVQTNNYYSGWYTKDKLFGGYECLTIDSTTGVKIYNLTNVPVRANIQSVSGGTVNIAESRVVGTVNWYAF